jgi:hypothetical protein
LLEYKSNTVTRQLQYWILAIILLAAPAAALNPHLNLTFRETVHENVTFAKDFFLVENRTYSLIEGVFTATNPGTETVFDTHIKIINIENLASNFLWVSGRNGSQTVFPDTTDDLQNLTTNITSSFSALPFDIDEDNRTDYVRVTADTIYFNVSSEFLILQYPIYNTTGAAMNLATPQTLNYTVNVTSIRMDGNYNEGVLFARLHINGTTSTANQLNVGEVTMELNDSARNYTVLHIPELRSGQASVFNYNVSGLSIQPPLDINTTYTNPLYETKVLAGQRFTINDTATNIAQVGALTIINISMYGMSVNVSNSTSWELHNFTLHNLSPTGDYTNVYGNGTDNRTWSWITNGGTIGIGETYSIVYQVQAPETVPSSGTYPAVEQNLSYTINATASYVAVQNVRSRAEVAFQTTKEIISPQDNDSNNNVTWRSVPTVSTYQNITYTLEKVTLWVTSGRNPNEVSNGLEYNYTVGADVNLSSTWIGSQWLFNYTDGSSDANPPPIVWIKPYWIIQNSGGQIINSSVTVNGTDTYVKYIYVVNGYWLEVFKNVTSAGNDQYDIKIHVHNRGNGHTPQNLTVTVYDFIPGEFAAWNFSPNYNNNSLVTGQFNGTAYEWDVGLRTTLGTSFSPDGAADGFDEFYLNYSVNGSGEYRVSDLYIVGLDPRKVDGAFTNDKVTVLTGIASTSKELIYLGIVVFLIAINIGNFLMTSRINNKLDKKE